MEVMSYRPRLRESRRRSEMGYFGVSDLGVSRVGPLKWSDLRS